MGQNLTEVTHDQLQGIKTIELKILKNALQVIDSLHLKYFALGGTCLGAVRHQGFIPWDDDIDIGMPRADYDIFVQNAGQYLNEGYFLQTYATDPEYPNMYAKVRDCNTTFIEASVSHLRINHGVYIDVFPLDRYPVKPYEKFLLELNKKLYNKRLADIYYQNQCSGMINKLKNAAARALTLNRSGQTLLMLQDKRYKQFNSALMVNYGGVWDNEISHEDVFGSGKKMQFEDVEIIVPEKCDAYLKQLYGDYMRFPPVEERNPHHYCSVVDLEKSYKNYI